MEDQKVNNVPKQGGGESQATLFVLLAEMKQNFAQRFVNDLERRQKSCVTNFSDCTKIVKFL